MNFIDYNSKVNLLLQHGSYSAIVRDVTSSHWLSKESHSSKYKSPRLYGPPEIHKHDLPTWSILIVIGSSYAIAKYLDKNTKKIHRES